ncbi:MAG TPA: sulfite reductase subunit alpha [Acetobacteraceae bacterium]|nr:sulfite reductase subunit alpha [Acetobacteraceae bacterium]
MNAIIPLIPENAPFSPTQRAWLNGFLAGLYGSAATGVSATPAPAVGPAEDFPWHDPVLELPERLAMAEGRALPQRLMAAMGQLDCGQCGYMCQSYAAALAEGREGSISLCVPGAKPTQLALKRLLAEAPPPPAAPTPQAAVVLSGREVHVVAAEPLTGQGSSKDVRHVVVDLRGSGLTYAPGDSLSIAVPNDPGLVDATLAVLRVTDNAAIRQTLTHELDIARPLDRTLDLLAMAAAHPRHAAALRALSEGENGAEPAGADLLDLLEAFPSARPPLADLLRSLPPLRPRLYSIASSQRVTPTEVHLCVAVVRETRRDRLRHGVASGFLADRATGFGPIRASVQTSHFRLPADAHTRIVMCGPGTGIAPFRAFLQERAALGIKGRAWVLFGERQRAHDFLYEHELKAWLADGTLSRLDAAFSRDQTGKHYVQHRMAENAADLWRWLQDGAHFFVCGDANRMARDVDAALRRIAMTEGRLDETQARDWIVALARQGRYQRDIY